jgi:hypothetical protein
MSDSLFFILAALCLIGLTALITEYRRKIRKDALDASLKHEMLERGMSADEIVRVLQARSGGSLFGLLRTFGIGKSPDQSEPSQHVSRPGP